MQENTPVETPAVDTPVVTAIVLDGKKAFSIQKPQPPIPAAEVITEEKVLQEITQLTTQLTERAKMYNDFVATTQARLDYLNSLVAVK